MRSAWALTALYSIALVGCRAGLPPASPTSPSPPVVPVEPVSGIYEVKVTGWEEATGILVSEDLEAELERQAPIVSPSEETSGRIVRAYLYELRDIKLRTGQQTGILTLEDSSVLRFDDYAKQATFEKTFGYVRVVSRPAGADIWIDEANRGRTTKEFVLSAGSHKIEVVSAHLNCDEHISVHDHEELEVTCPRK